MTITQANGFVLFIVLCPALMAQSPPGFLSTANVLSAPNDTNLAAAVQFQQQLEEAKLLARQAILEPVAPPDVTRLDKKDLKAMSPEELGVLMVLKPEKLNPHLEALKTHERKEQERQVRSAILDPVAHNRALEKTKTPQQKQKEAEAARAILNPRTPSLKEFHSHSIARPQ